MNNQRTARAQRGLASLLTLGALLALGETARADVNICWELVEPIWVPPTPLEIPECIAANGPLCFFLPHCCGPTCRLHPECVLGGTFLEGHWDTLECKLMPPEVALEQFLRGLLRPADDALEPIRAAAEVQIEILRAGGVQIPAVVQTIANELLAQPSLAGLPRFQPGHAARARLQPERTPTAGLYLTRGFGAITLDRLIILRNATFDALFAEPARTTQDVLCGNTSPAFRSALLTLMHELVHVRQWEILGEDTFLTNYLLETLTQGYGQDAFETEAFALGNAVAALLPTQVTCSVTPPPTPPPTPSPAALCLSQCISDCEDTCPSGRAYPVCRQSCRVECKGDCSGL